MSLYSTIRPNQKSLYLGGTETVSPNSECMHTSLQSLASVTDWDPVVLDATLHIEARDASDFSLLLWIYLSCHSQS